VNEVNRAEKFLRVGLTFGLISGQHEADLRSKKKLPLNLLFPDRVIYCEARVETSRFPRELRILFGAGK